MIPFWHSVGTAPMLPRDLGGRCSLTCPSLRSVQCIDVARRRRRSAHVEGLRHEQRARRRRFAHAAADCGAYAAHGVRDRREGEPRVCHILSRVERTHRNGVSAGFGYHPGTDQDILTTASRSGGLAASGGGRKLMRKSHNLRIVRSVCLPRLRQRFMYEYTIFECHCASFPSIQRSKTACSLMNVQICSTLSCSLQFATQIQRAHLTQHQRQYIVHLVGYSIHTSQLQLHISISPPRPGPLRRPLSTRYRSPHHHTSRPPTRIRTWACTSHTPDLE